MFNKIATELRKVEYPRKTRQRVPAELRNFTYIPIQQVRQPISLSQPGREVPIYPTVLQRQTASQHVAFPSTRPLFPEKTKKAQLPHGTLMLQSKPENEILQDKRAEVLHSPTKLIHQLQRDFRLKHQEQQHQEVLANISSQKSSRKFPIFVQDKQQSRKHRRKSAIFKVQTNRSPSRRPIFKEQNQVSKSTNTRFRIFENQKNTVRPKITESKIFHQPTQQVREERQPPKVQKIQTKRSLILERPVSHPAPIFRTSEPIFTKIPTIRVSKGTNTESRYLLQNLSSPTPTTAPNPISISTPPPISSPLSTPIINITFPIPQGPQTQQQPNRSNYVSSYTPSTNIPPTNIPPASAPALNMNLQSNIPIQNMHTTSIFRSEAPPTNIPQQIPTSQPPAQIPNIFTQSFSNNPHNPSFNNLSYSPINMPAQIPPSNATPTPPPFSSSPTNIPIQKYSPPSAIRYGPYQPAQQLQKFINQKPPTPVQRPASPAPKYIPLPPPVTSTPNTLISPKAAAKKQGQSKRVKQNHDPMMLLMVLLTVVSIIWLLTELYTNFR